MVCPIHIHHSISQYYWTFHVTLAGETGYNYSLGYWHQISNSYPKSYLNRDCNVTFTISSNNIITFKENQVKNFFNIWFTKYRYINWPSPCIQGGLGWGGCNPHYEKLKCWEHTLNALFHKPHIQKLLVKHALVRKLYMSCFDCNTN